MSVRERSGQVGYISESKEADTPGMTDEYDVQSYLNADFMCKEFAAKYRRTAATHDRFRVQRDPKDDEFTQTRRGGETEENLEISAKETNNDVSLRVAGSSRRVVWVFRH